MLMSERTVMSIPAARPSALGEMASDVSECAECKGPVIRAALPGIGDRFARPTKHQALSKG